MAGKFVVKKGSTGKFRFNLVSSNGQVVATSEAYNSKASAMTGIRAVKSLAAAAEVEDLTVLAGTARKAVAAPEKAAAAAGKPAGGACGYYTNVGLFGGPPERRGCGQTIPPGNAASASPSVELPQGGSTTAVSASDSDGALAQYGPAVVFCGKAPKGSSATPPTGPIQVSTKGKTSVASSASVKSVDTGPFSADSVRSTCSASKSGAKASTAIIQGVVVTATDAGGNPTASKRVPAKPSVNLMMKGKIANGDKFKIVFNEQKKSRDGTITVTAVHVYLLGPTAVGDVVIAQSHARA
ncbi:MAG: choice-of-anchor P family protein [Acidimicrobiales bacterium]